MFLTFRRHVEQLLAEALEKCQYPSDNLALTVKPGYADLTSLIAFKLSPILRLKPQEIAQNVAEYLGADELVARADAAGPDSTSSRATTTYIVRFAPCLRQIVTTATLTLRGQWFSNTRQRILTDPCTSVTFVTR